MFTFTNPTYQRFPTLPVAALLTTGRRTVANVARTLRHLAPSTAPATSAHSPAPLVRAGARLRAGRFLLWHFVPDGTVALIGDDTVDGHKGKYVHGKARHRDPVRSTLSDTTRRYGHRWGVSAVLVKFLFAPAPGRCRARRSKRPESSCRPPSSRAARGY